MSFHFLSTFFARAHPPRLDLKAGIAGVVVPFSVPVLTSPFPVSALPFAGVVATPFEGTERLVLVFSLGSLVASLVFLLPATPLALGLVAEAARLLAPWADVGDGLGGGLGRADPGFFLAAALALLLPDLAFGMSLTSTKEMKLLAWLEEEDCLLSKRPVTATIVVVKSQGQESESSAVRGGKDLKGWTQLKV